MEKVSKKVTIGCISPLTVLLFLAFFAAKIFDKIDWSWLWVFSPLWIPTVIGLLILTLIGIAYIILIIIGIVFNR